MGHGKKDWGTDGGDWRLEKWRAGRSEARGAERKERKEDEDGMERKGKKERRRLRRRIG